MTEASKRTIALASLCFGSLASCSGATLRDIPFAGDGNYALYLDGDQWNVTNANDTISIGVTVPGDLITDLQTARLIGDPLHELNFQGNLWDSGNWTYSTVFDATSELLNAGEVYLVFDSIKMAADVYLNGQYLGGAWDQFLRYAYPVKSAIKTSGNELSVVFSTSADPRMAEGRYMDCSGAWDWAPYSTTLTPEGGHTFSKGLVKSVYLVPVTAAAIAHIVPQISYAGEYPTAPLTDEHASPFNVTVNIVLAVPQGADASGNITVTGSWASGSPVTVTVPSGRPSSAQLPSLSASSAAASSRYSFAASAPSIGGAELTVTVTLPPAVGVDLWWPAGVGRQALYSIDVVYTPAAAAVAGGIPLVDTTASSAATIVDQKLSSATAGGLDARSDANSSTQADNGDGWTIRASRSVGFRVAYLVTANDSNPSALEGVEGSDDFTMRFKINGADVYSRGANMIPMEELEGRQSAEAYQQLLASAVAANMNTLRVWGGGTFLPQAFYEACDELGVLLYHDVMYGRPWFGGVAGTPADTPTQAAEIAHAVRRLSAHPSIITWNGGNEWTGSDAGSLPPALWEQFVLPAIAAVDSSRPLWPASPSNGFQTGVWRLTGLPNGNPFVIANTSALRTIETHGYYQHGEGFETVNSGAALQPFSPNIPPSLEAANTTYGPHQLATYASEYGCSSFSSFESMSPTLDPTHWYAHSPPMQQRNYACDNIIEAYFGASALSPVTTPSALGFQQTTYLCMLGQALWMKGTIEGRRSGNAWGSLTWQLGEIWPTGGWGSLEYGTVGWTAGQVLGGRWKPTHHWMSSHLYKDTMIACGADARCYIKNDAVFPADGFNGSWSLTAVHLSSGKTAVLSEGDISLPRGGGAAAWMCADGSGEPSTSTCTPWATLLPSVGCLPSGSDCVLVAELVASSGETADQHVILMAPTADLTIPAAAVIAEVRGAAVATDAAAGMSSGKRGATGLNAMSATDVLSAAHRDDFIAAAAAEPPINIILSSNTTALYVTLTTQAQGRFSDNAFLLPGPGVATVQFYPFMPGQEQALRSSLRIDHLALYL